MMQWSTIADANDGWRLELMDNNVYSDKNDTKTQGSVIVVEGNGSIKIKLQNVEAPTDENSEKTVYVKVKATKAGQNDTTQTLELKYKKTV